MATNGPTELSQLESEQKYADILFATIKESSDITNLSAPKIVSLVAMSVVGANSFEALPGPSKKAVVLRVIDMLIDTIPADATDRASIMLAVELLAPPMIDALVAASKAGAAAATGIAATVSKGGCQCAIS
jgi:hypothetical protein